MKPELFMTSIMKATMMGRIIMVAAMGTVATAVAAPRMAAKAPTAVPAPAAKAEMPPPAKAPPAATRAIGPAAGITVLRAPAPMARAPSLPECLRS